MGSPQFPHLPPAVAERLNVALALGAQLDAVRHLVAQMPLDPADEVWREALRYHVDSMRLWFAEARKEAGWHG